MQLEVKSNHDGILEIVNELPEELKHFKLPLTKPFSISGIFGNALFQHMQGEYFDIWLSHYLAKINTDLSARGNFAIVEFHMPWDISFESMWDGIPNASLQSRQFNISSTSYIKNKAKFLPDKKYSTFDIHFHLPFLKSHSAYFPKLQAFLDKVEQEEPADISPLKHTASERMIFAIQNIFRADYHSIMLERFIESNVFIILTEALKIVEQEQISFRISKPYDISCLHEAKRIIELEFDEPPSLAKLSRRIGLNLFKLKIGFREHFGMSTFDYVRVNKMEKAKILLLETQKPVKEIAIECGYANAITFCRQFKKYVHQSPLQYRKKPSIEHY